MRNKVVSLIACRRTLHWRDSARGLRAWGLAGALVAGSSLLVAGTLRANTEDDVLSGLASGSDLSAASSYSTTAPSTGGVPTTTSDVTFTAAGTYASPYTFGSSLSIGSLNDLSATALTLQNNVGTLTLNGGDSVSGNTADLLYVASGGSLTVAASNGFSVALGASGNFDVVGAAAVSAPITGAFALTKTGAGTLTLGGNSTYTGGTTVSAGTLLLNAGGGSGAVRGTLTVNPGATLTLGVNNALGYTAGTQVATLNINGGTVNTTGALGDEGYLTSFNLTGGTLAYAGGSYQIAAADASAPGITSNASADLSTISGGINIRSGNLPINVAQGTTTGGVDLQISGVIASSGTFGVTKGGAGNLLLSNFNTYTGGTTVNAGTLTLGTGGGSGVVRGAVTVNTGATLALASANALGYTSGQMVTVLNIAGGTVNIATAASADQGFLTGLNFTGGTFTSTGGGSLDINPGDASAPGITSNASATTALMSSGIDIRAANNTTAGTLAFTVAKGTTASGNDLTISGAITSTQAAFVSSQNANVFTTGGFGLSKAGAGTLNLTGANSFAGNVAVTAGTLNIGVGGADDGSTSALGSSTTNTAKTATVSSGATLSVTANNVFGRGANPALLPTITLNGGTLSTTRYFAVGALNLNGATVTSTDAADTGSYQTYQLRGNVTVGGTAASTINATTTSATTGGIHLDTNTLFTVGSTGAAGADLTVNAPFRNRSGDYQNTAGGLTKAGAGTMLLTAVNTYTGTTAVSAGTLAISGSINNSPTVNVTAGALTLTNPTATALADNGTLSLTSGSTLNLNANAGTSEIISALVLDGTSEPAQTYTAAQLTALDPNVTFSSLGGETLTITPVPEPATLGSGMILLAAFAWHLRPRRRRKA